MTLASAHPTQRTSLAALLPRRPRRRELVLPRLEGSVPPVLGARAASRRRLFASLAGPVLRPQPGVERDPVLTLVNRITQGFNLAEYERARALGYQAYLEEQLEPLALDDSAMDARLAGSTTLLMSPKQLYEGYAEDFTEPYYQFKGATLLRSVHSKRQLLERMCEFWNDHFCIDQNKSDLEWVFLPEHERLVISQHALGSFPALLSACAHDAAMLFYLDNWLNARGAPQENYARELLELHTMGVHGGYSEVDVREVAKCFTGWTLNLDFNSPDFLRARFDPFTHTPGSKSVLGELVPASPGQANAQRVLDIVVAHPSTADFLARKLIAWFLTPTPPESLVERVKASYAATNGDIKAMLRVILARENMSWASPLTGFKLRRPFHYVVSLLRTLDTNVSDPLYPLYYLYGMGHVPFDHVQPNGYPDTVAAWGSSLLPRWGFASALLPPTAVVANPMPGVSFSFNALKAKLGYTGPVDRPGLAARINARLLGRRLGPLETAELQEFIDTYPTTFNGGALLESIALAASFPGFQWY